MGRILPFLLGAVCAWGCGDSAPSTPPAPAPPPAPIPPPEPPLPEPEGDVVVGFARDRIEIREGQTVPLEVRFEADEDLGAWFHHVSVPLRVTFEAGTAVSDDVLVAREVGVYGFAFGRTGPVDDGSLVLVRAREDGLTEGTESLRLRLSTESDPARSIRYEQPVRVAFRRAEIEVVILDGADRCSAVRLTAAVPRRSRSGASCQLGIYETDLVVESDAAEFLRLDPDPISRILRIRTAPAGNGFRHRLTVQWKLSRTAWDFRFRPCLDPGRGPTLICSNVACRVFAEGEPVPPPERPVCGAVLDGGAP